MNPSMNIRTVMQYIYGTMFILIQRTIGFVKRKGTKAGRRVVDPEEKEEFRRSVQNVMDEYSIPPELVLNIDQTGRKLFPSSQWTLEEKGAKQVLISGHTLQWCFQTCN